jgi:hypothetical protein
MNKEQRICGYLAAGFLVAVLIMLGACGDPGETTISSTTSGTTSSTGPTPAFSTTVASTAATATTAPKPTTTKSPTPEPSSVFIPREKLPGGQIFKTGYFALLKGEGATYLVFDCRGQFVYRFTYSDSDGEINNPNGLYTEEQLWAQGFMDPAIAVEALQPSEDPYIRRIRSYQNGFYQIARQNDQTTVDLYNKSGKKIRSLSCESKDWVETNVAAYNNETLVCFNADNQNRISFVRTDGVVRKTLVIEDFSYGLQGLLAEKYCVFDDQMLDLDHKLIKTFVSIPWSIPVSICGNEGYPNYHVCNFFMTWDVLYDARTMKPVPAGTIDADGNLIEGATYVVQGITCIGKDQTVAIGTAGDQLAIKTRDAEYVVNAGGWTFHTMNKTMLLLRDPSEDQIRIISLATGKQIADFAISTDITIADEYMIVKKDKGFYILDQDGNIRYASAKSEAWPADTDCIVLHRGPYIGIADLNGNWLVKTLAWELTRDAAFGQGIE